MNYLPKLCMPRRVLVVILANLFCMPFAIATCPTTPVLNSPENIVSMTTTDCKYWQEGNLTIDSGVTLGSYSSPYDIVNVTFGLPVGVLINNGTVLSGDGLAFFLKSEGSSVINNGSVLTNGYGATAISFQDAFGSLTNNGIISIADGADIGSAISVGGINLGKLRNNGTISAVSGDAIYNAGYLGYYAITELTNTGTISVSGTSGNGVNNGEEAVITSFINSGTIISTATGGSGINNSGSIVTLTNNGTISGTRSAIVNDTGATIGTLNNLQGGDNALTYIGSLPSAYNVIINSATNYGKLNGLVISDAMTFGIYAGSIVNKGTYTAVLDGIAAENLSGPITGNYQGFTYALNLEPSSSTVWDLLITGASTVDTQATLMKTSMALQNVFASQNNSLVTGLTYDCSLFDQRGMCVSAGARYQTIDSSGAHTMAALLVGAYRISDHFKIGAYLDQSAFSGASSDIIKLKNTSPMFGLFGVWSQRYDGTGVEAKVAVGYADKEFILTRPTIGSAEAGVGASQINSQGISIVAKYHVGVDDKTTVSPYLGARYTSNKMRGYREQASNAVTAPLTYDDLKNSATTVLAGVEANYPLNANTTILFSVGVENDINTSNGVYRAAGISDLTAINFNLTPVKTRPSASLSAFYTIEKNQHIGLTGSYRQEAYQGVHSTSLLATYTRGF